MRENLHSKRAGLNRLLRGLYEPASVTPISESDLAIRWGYARSLALQAMRLSRFLAPNPATRIPSGAARPPTWALALPGMPTALAQLLEAATAMLPATEWPPSASRSW
jgi:hypothetical protein